MILQCPSRSLKVVVDQAKWHALLRGSIDIIDREIGKLDRQHNVYHQDARLNPIFVEFAARAAALVFWDVEIGTNDEGEQVQKKRKKSMKLDSFVEHICLSADKFSYRWVLVMCRSFQQQPFLLAEKDYPVLLKMLSDFVKSLQTTDEVNCCLMLTEILLNLENVSKVTILPVHVDLWNNITLATFRLCASNNKVSDDCHSLLTLFVLNQKFKSNDFVTSYLQACLAGTIKKTNSSMQTVITMLLSFNINLIPQAKETIKSLISLLLISNAKQLSVLMAAADKKPSEQLVSVLLVICTTWTSLYKDGLADKLLKYLHKDILPNYPNEFHYKNDVEYIR